MRVVTWNLFNGAGAAAWPRLRTALGVDLLFFQEAKPPAAEDGLVWEAVPGNRWGSGVLTTWGRFRPVPIPNYEGWMVGGELIGSGWNDADRPLYAFSIHTPSPGVGRTRLRYVPEFRNFLDELGRQVPRGSDLILAGDFNFTLGERTAGESLKTTDDERRVLAQLSEMGLACAWTTTHAGRPLAQTLRWTTDSAPGRTTPYHCDGIFLPAAWADGLISEVLTSACFEVSDHYPVAAWVPRPDRSARDAWCSFCAKNHRDAGPLVEGPNHVYICGQCLQACEKVFNENRRPGR